MFSLKTSIYCLCVVLQCCLLCFGIPKEQFFPFGTGNGDKKLEKNDEHSSEEIQLSKPLRFYEVTYTSLYINVNGFVSFTTEIPRYRNEQIPIDNYPLIAVFYADIDTREAGELFYRESQKPDLLERASDVVRKQYTDARNYTAATLFIVTWENVGHFDKGKEKVNTFQLLLTSDESGNSYAFFLYADNEIRWIRGKGRNPNKEDAPAQAGFQNDDGRFYNLPASGTAEMERVNSLTNVGIPGLFVYRISGEAVLDPREIGLDDYEEEEYPEGYFYGSDEDCGDNEAWSECGEKCPRTCDNSKPGEDTECTGECVAGCICKEGFIRSTLGGNCVPKDKCSETTSCEGENQIFMECGTACPPSCENPNPETCSLQCIKGCFCKDNFYKYGERCIPLEQCPALTTDSSNVEQTPSVEVTRPSPTGPDEGCPGLKAPCVEPGCRVEKDENSCDVCVCVAAPIVPPEKGPETEQSKGDESHAVQSCNPSKPDCDDNAQCFRYEKGHCCKCNPGFFGNGKLCLKNDEPQRVNGQFSGRINDVEIPESEFHSYVVTSDGRAYVALSKIPEKLGSPLLFLNAIGENMGWLFAKPAKEGAKNGFMLTGGVFNRTATVHIGETYTVTIQQEFSGKDIFNYLKAKVFINGNLPTDHSNDEEFRFSDYSEEYRKVSAGILKAYSRFDLIVGNQKRYQIVVDQTIRYKECPHQNTEQSTEETYKLLGSRNLVIYDKGEKLVRYAAQYAVDTVQDSENPCAEGRHGCTGANMACAIDGRGHKCLCLDGFELLSSSPDGKDQQCIDIDECARGLHTCDPNAHCRNKAGGYDCICRTGYRGTGFKCVGEQTCEQLACDSNAECVTDPGGYLHCVCRPGFHGNGKHCQEDQREGRVCRSHQECHKYGECAYNKAHGRYQCRCRRGFSGDGVHCEREAETCDVGHNCHAEAECVLEETEIGPGFVCRCKAGFQGDGYSCKKLEVPNTVQCNVLNNCHPNAYCAPDPKQNAYVCKCHPGFQGDGYQCVPVNRPGKRCRSFDECHENAHCVYDETLAEHVCECLPGFRGDAVQQCLPADECNPRNSSSCDRNARCTFNEDERAYVCECLAGFVGNGQVCLRQSVAQRPEGCDRLRNCDSNADCVPDNRISQYVCQCRSGFDGDGLTCYESSTNCRAKPEMCSKDADCVPGPDNLSFQCRCRAGFLGDGQTCSKDESREPSASRSDSGVLLYGRGMTLMQRSTAPESFAKQLLVLPAQLVVGISQNCKDDKIYWSDISGHSIGSAELNGTNVTAVLSEGLESPEGIAVDHSSQLLYYTDSGKDVIGVVSLDGQKQKNIITDGLVNPRAIALDLSRGHMFWSDWDRNSPSISRANMDGTSAQKFIESDIRLPNGLAILQRRQELCWVDAGTHRLECISLSGNVGRRVVHAPLSYPFGLTVHNEQTFYWTDWEDKRIHSVSVYGGSVTSFPASIGGSGKPYGIWYLQDVCPHGRTACENDNGGCKSELLCVPREQSRVCLCPEGLSEEECSKIRDVR